jgi:hypothetical protein
MRSSHLYNLGRAFQSGTRSVSGAALPNRGKGGRWTLRQRPRAAVPRAEGGTPDPCHRDHPAQPGVKLEPPQPPVGRLAVPAAGAAARRNDVMAMQ